MGLIWLVFKCLSKIGERPLAPLSLSGPGGTAIPHSGQNMTDPFSGTDELAPGPQASEYFNLHALSGSEMH
jgi:hypothetical protein